VTFPFVLALASAAAAPLADARAAESLEPVTAVEPGEPPSADGRFEGRQLPAALMPSASRFWVLGVAVEEYGRGTNTRDVLYGLSGTWRVRSFGPNALVMLKPGGSSYEDTRFLAGLGLRSYLPIFGIEFSYGVSVQIEARLEDHFWLASATPFELGAVVFSKGSWQVEVFAGARHAFAGELINSFLLDPNGLENQEASDVLYRTKTLHPWGGFLRLVFGRRLD